MLRELEGEAHQRQAEAQAQKALVDGARRELEGARRELEASQKELGALNSQLAERELELGREREGVRGLRAQLERVAADHATLLRALDGAKEAATAQEEKLQRALAEVENQRRAADASRTQAGLLRKKLEASASATEQSLTALAGLREARESLLKEQQRLEEAEKRVTASVEALARTAGVEKGATPAAARVEGKQRRPSLPKVGAPARQLEEVALARGSERPSLIPADAVEEDTD